MSKDALLTQQQWSALRNEGHVRVPVAFEGSLFAELEASLQALQSLYPYGTTHPTMWTGKKPEARKEPPKPTDAKPTIIIRDVGFLDPVFLKPLARPQVYGLLKDILGTDFCLSNVWLQIVPPGTPRMGYHRDERGSITLNILFDDIGSKMGSTCLIPGSHIGTPPPQFCMRDRKRDHPGEVDMTGNAGDLIIFSNEAWHARAQNVSNQYTRRLFYNFYARSSRATTVWSGAVSDNQIADAKAVLPEAYHHMLRVDPALTRQLGTVRGSRLRRWAFAASSSNHLLRGLVYGQYTYGRSVEHDIYPGYLLPYTTRLAEFGRFDAIGYVSRIRPVPTLTLAARQMAKTAVMRGAAERVAADET